MMDAWRIRVSARSAVAVCLALSGAGLVRGGADAVAEQDAGQRVQSTKISGAREGSSVEARLWFVGFDRSVARDALPFDPLEAGHILHDARPDAKGRIPTWGLAMQLPKNKLAVESSRYRLTMRDDALETKKDEGAGDAPPWQIYAAPRLILHFGQQGAVSVGRPVSYLVRDENGCLKVQESEEISEGVVVTLTAKHFKDGEIRFEDIHLTSRRVTSRQPIDGVPLDVGAPVIDSRETILNISIKPESVGIIPLPQGPDEPAILVFITAKIVDGDGK
ncbi:MAG: hypothetical protein U1D55_14880 [Phycisphaerae bacterium]